MLDYFVVRPFVCALSISRNSRTNQLEGSSSEEWEQEQNSNKFLERKFEFQKYITI